MNKKLLPLFPMLIACALIPVAVPPGEASTTQTASAPPEAAAPERSTRHPPETRHHDLEVGDFPSPPFLAGCQVLPSNNIWNTPVDELPIHPNSDAYIESIGANTGLHPDFGAGFWPPGSESPIGIPFNLVPGGQPGVSVSFYYPDESDPGPYPIPQNPLIEGGPNGTGDRHILVLDTDNCILYEVFDAWPDGNGGWDAGSGAIFDLKSNVLRPTGWTSADAAGLPILPGLVLYDEVASGTITHALRFTANTTQRAYLWPARHYASSMSDLDQPPMGLRLRLKANFEISGFSPNVQVILQALKIYGMMLADNGSSWYISGAPDERWENDTLVGELAQVPGSAFEAVDVTSLIVDPNSGQAGYTGFSEFLFMPVVSVP